MPTMAAAALTRSSGCCSTCAGSTTWMDSKSLDGSSSSCGRADPRPLEPVLEHNRLDLVSLAAVTSRAPPAHGRGGAGLSRRHRSAGRRTGPRAGRVLERAALCYERARSSPCVETRAQAVYRLGLRWRRDRCFEDAAACWRELLASPTSRRAGAIGCSARCGSSRSRRSPSITSTVRAICNWLASWCCRARRG